MAGTRRGVLLLAFLAMPTAASESRAGDPATGGGVGRPGVADAVRLCFGCGRPRVASGTTVGTAPQGRFQSGELAETRKAVASRITRGGRASAGPPAREAALPSARSKADPGATSKGIQLGVAVAHTRHCRVSVVCVPVLIGADTSGTAVLDRVATEQQALPRSGWRATFQDELAAQPTNVIPVDHISAVSELSASSTSPERDDRHIASRCPEAASAACLGGEAGAIGRVERQGRKSSVVASPRGGTRFPPDLSAIAERFATTGATRRLEFCPRRAATRT